MLSINGISPTKALNFQPWNKGGWDMPGCEKEAFNVLIDGAD